MARSTKRVCRDCGFFLPLAGSLGAMFGVCGNELSADGHVVDKQYGCGAHSDTPAPAGTGSPMYEPYDDGVLDVDGEADRRPRQSRPSAACRVVGALRSSHQSRAAGIVGARSAGVVGAPAGGVVRTSPFRRRL